MSDLKYGHHSICVWCRQSKCDTNSRCKECADWSLQDMEDYLKHRHSLESKNKKSKPVVSERAGNDPVQVVSLSSNVEATKDSQLKAFREVMQP